MSVRTVGKAVNSYGDRKITLRRPHESSSINNSPQKLIHLLSTIQSEKNEDEKYEKCIDLYNKLATNNEAAINVIRHLHTACIMDGSITRQTAVFLSKLIKGKGDGGSYIRSQWLLLLQEDFEGRLTLRANAPETFRNVVLCLGEVYNTLLVASEPIKVLSTPLVHYMKMLLDSGTKEDFRVLLIQLVANGNYLKEQGGTPYEELHAEIRKCLLHSKEPQLVLAVDISNGNFPHAKGSLRDVYVSSLKDDYLALECRALGIPFQPSEPKPANLPIEKLSLADEVKPITKVPEKVPVAKVSEKLPIPETVSREDARPSVVQQYPDVNEVRERMRLKGLFHPRPVGKSAQREGVVHVDKDDEFYGAQLPGRKSTDFKGLEAALAVPLPTWDD